jgi:hypothetical protein
MITAKFEMLGMMRTNAWIAYMGNKVLCDKRSRVRRFVTHYAAIKAANRAAPSEFK